MKPGSEDIRRLFGTLDDDLIAEIESSGVTLADLEDVAALLAQETDVMGEARHPLTGAPRVIYDLLQRRDAFWDEDR